MLDQDEPTRPSKPMGDTMPATTAAPWSDKPALAGQDMASVWDLVSIVAETPRWYRMSAWSGHVPFALWLISVLRPATLVELGTYSGVSFCAFLQAMARCERARQAVAVDTWQGDEFTGSYPEHLYLGLKAHCEEQYGGLARLLRMTFDEALDEVADGTVDLLHIDGSHTYEAVRHDFETWLPKLAPNAVVLFHDVAERRPRFGVWRLWDELCGRHRTLTFEHCSGLGVLAIGPDVPAPLASLLSDPGERPPPAALAARRLFAVFGAELQLPPEPPPVVRKRVPRTPANLWAFLTKRPLV